MILVEVWVYGRYIFGWCRSAIGGFWEFSFGKGGKGCFCFIGEVKNFIQIIGLWGYGLI